MDTIDSGTGPGQYRDMTNPPFERRHHHLAPITRPAGWAGRLNLPFSAVAWRRTLYVALVGPAAIIAVADGGHLQQRLAAGLLGRTVRATRLRGLLGLPLYLPFLVLVGYGWWTVAMNLAYPLRPLFGIPGYDPNSWGGPSYSGVWAFHAFLGGVPIALVMPWIVRGLSVVQARLLGR